MFEFDKNIADDLDGKILFDYLSNTAFSNGKKYKLEQKGIYQDGEFYIPIAEFNKAYGKNAELDNGVVKSDGKSFAAVSYTHLFGFVRWTFVCIFVIFGVRADNGKQNFGQNRVDGHKRIARIREEFCSRCDYAVRRGKR